MKTVKALAIIVMLLILQTGCAHKRKVVPEKKVTPVVVVKLQPQPARNTQIFNGVIRARDQVEIVSKVEGTIEKMYVEIGSDVKKGDLLAKIDATVYQAQYESAKATYDLAKLSFARQENLYKESVISQQDYDTAQAQLTQAGSMYKLAEKSYNDCFIKAPFAGTVAFRAYKEGNYLKSGTKLFTLVNFAVVEVPFGVTERYAVKIKKGKSAKVTLASLPGRVFNGSVSSLGLMADDTTGTFPVEVVVKNENKILRPGMVAEVELGIDYLGKAKVIDLATIISRSDNKGVYVLDEQAMTVSYKPIEIGFEFGEKAMVLSGLNYGELIVVKGHKNITEGEKVATANAL